MTASFRGWSPEAFLSDKAGKWDGRARGVFLFTFSDFHDIMCKVTRRGKDPRP